MDRVISIYQYLGIDIITLTTCTHVHTCTHMAQQGKGSREFVRQQDGMVYGRVWREEKFRILCNYHFKNIKIASLVILRFTYSWD